MEAARPAARAEVDLILHTASPFPEGSVLERRGDRLAPRLRLVT
jgi:hypothetical protein